MEFAIILQWPVLSWHFVVAPAKFVGPWMVPHAVCIPRCSAIRENCGHDWVVRYRPMGAPTRADDSWKYFTSLLIAMGGDSLVESLLPHELYHILKITQNYCFQTTLPSDGGSSGIPGSLPSVFQPATLFPMSYDMLLSSTLPKLSQISPLACLNLKCFCFLRRNQLALGWGTRSWPSCLHLEPRSILSGLASKYGLRQENSCESINSEN